ncbi:MAG: hypothetical protein HOY78_27815 [Saccharothrix sp.]|nr:hypothetical protein [Saccharothrix sp.]
MRVLLRVLSPFLGLAVAAAGVVLVAEVAWHWSGRGHLVPWSRLAGLRWTDERVRAVALLTVAAGVALLVLAAFARRKFVRLHSPADGIVVVTTPTGLARVVGNRVRAEDGVTGASVTASRRRVHVRATSGLHDEATLRPRLLAVAREAVANLPLPHHPKVSVVVHSPKDRPFQDRPLTERAAEDSP